MADDVHSRFFFLEIQNDITKYEHALSGNFLDS